MSQTVLPSSFTNTTFVCNNLSLETRDFKVFNVLHFPVVNADYELPIDSFVYSDCHYRIDPPLSFKWRKNYKLKQFEISGRGIYDDIFAYGETLTEALEMLTEAILPTFWEECLTFNVTAASQKLAQIALDIKNRVQVTVPGNEDLLYDGGFRKKGG